MTDRAKIEALTAYFKKRFPNLSTEETIKMVMDVLEIVGA
jgi:hypothetical protein